MTAKSYHDRLSARIAEIAAGLVKNHVQDLTNTTGTLPSKRVPSATGGTTGAPGTKGGVSLSDDDPEPLGTPDPGSGLAVSHANHVHGHGNLPGGTLHAVATDSVAGFMSAADKAKEDGYPDLTGLTPGYVLTALTSTTADFAPASGGGGLPVGAVGDMIYYDATNTPVLLEMSGVALGSAIYATDVGGNQIPQWDIRNGLAGDLGGSTDAAVVTGLQGFPISTSDPITGDMLIYDGSAYLPRALVAADIPNLDWTKITTGLPTTLAGYGITDAYTKTAADARYAPIAVIGSVTSVNITAPAAGITAAGGPITTSGSITLALADDLAALEALSSTGLAARTAANTWAQRTIAGTSNRITLTNGDGVSGNPTVDISTSYVGQSTIDTVGIISSGTWRGTRITLAYGGTGADLSATGGAGQYLKQISSGAAITVGAIPATDLAYSGLTAGQIFQATGASAAGFAALNLATAASITGILPSTNGGTGINNAGKLTLATDVAITGGGTLALGGFTLTAPASGTAALRGVANTFSEENTFGKIVRMPVTAGTNGYGLRFWDGTNDFGNFQSLDLGGIGYVFFSTNRYFDGGAWQSFNTRVGGDLQITGDSLQYATFPVSSNSPVSQFSVGVTGIVNARAGYTVGGTQVLTSRQTGWNAPTGTLTRGTFAVTGATTASIAQALAALITDVRTHGLIGT